MMKQVLQSVGDMEFQEEGQGEDDAIPEEQVNYGLDLIDRMSKLFQELKKPLNGAGGFGGAGSQAQGINISQVRQTLVSNSVFQQVTLEEFDSFLVLFDQSSTLNQGWITDKEFKELASRHEKELLTYGGLNIDEDDMMSQTPGAGQFTGSLLEGAHDISSGREDGNSSGSGGESERHSEREVLEFSQPLPKSQSRAPSSNPQGGYIKDKASKDAFLEALRQNQAQPQLILLDILQDIVQQRRYQHYAPEEWTPFFIGFKTQIEKVCKKTDGLEASLKQALNTADALKNEKNELSVNFKREQENNQKLQGEFLKVEMELMDARRVQAERKEYYDKYVFAQKSLENLDRQLRDIKP